MFENNPRTFRWKTAKPLCVSSYFKPGMSLLSPEKGLGHDSISPHIKIRRHVKLCMELRTWISRFAALASHKLDAMNVSLMLTISLPSIDNPIESEPTNVTFFTCKFMIIESEI